MGCGPGEVTDRCVRSGCQHPGASDTSVLVASGATWSDRGVQTSLALARAQLRHGWRNLAGIVVLVALIGGLVLGGLAGAQRTRTAVDRMIEQNEVSDVLVNPDKGDESVLDFDLVAALPMVAEFSRVHGVGAWPSGEITIDNLFTAPFTLATDGQRPRGLRSSRPVRGPGARPGLGRRGVRRSHPCGRRGARTSVTPSASRLFPPEVLGADVRLVRGRRVRPGAGHAERAGRGHDRRPSRRRDRQRPRGHRRRRRVRTAGTVDRAGAVRAVG